MGHARATWPMPPQYKHHPSRILCCHSSGIKVFRLAPRSTGPRCVPVVVERVWLVGSAHGVVSVFPGAGFPFFSAFQALIWLFNYWRKATNPWNC
jgi:hypothetical protein